MLIASFQALGNEWAISPPCCRRPGGPQRARSWRDGVEIRGPQRARFWRDGVEVRAVSQLERRRRETLSAVEGAPRKMPFDGSMKNANLRTVRRESNKEGNRFSHVAASVLRTALQPSADRKSLCSALYGTSARAIALLRPAKLPSAPTSGQAKP
jgi:hypothetical protein